MTGKYDVLVKDRNVRYQFVVKRKYTILTGDSTTGKSSLYNLLFEQVSVNCSIPIVPVPNSNYIEVYLYEIKLSSEESNGLANGEIVFSVEDR